METTLLDGTGVLVDGVLDEGELVLMGVLLEVLVVELGSATDEDVQPTRSSAADAASAAITALGPFVRVVTPPPRVRSLASLGQRVTALTRSDDHASSVERYTVSLTRYYR
jgi:hypothetical protein